MIRVTFQSAEYFNVEEDGYYKGTVEVLAGFHFFVPNDAYVAVPEPRPIKVDGVNEDRSGEDQAKVLQMIFNSSIGTRLLEGV
jgi:hypothetical protein